ncbi:MAG: hypothetical protein P9L99_19450 [Candidatus Lernaella stagnicola]|nr:hypothetical protein [Candidatus Lernaella stagnicola]
MARICPFVLFAIVTAFLALGACAGDGIRPDGDLTPELLDMVAIPNPADVGSETTFIASFVDHDGDIEDFSIELIVETEDDEEKFEVPAIDLRVEGLTEGSISFRVNVLDYYQGTFKLRLIDAAGNVSDEIEEFLFVNILPEPQTGE